MTVKEFYVARGNSKDWECRRKIERAVMQNYKISWKDELTDEVISHIINADIEYNQNIIIPKEKLGIIHNDMPQFFEHICGLLKDDKIK